MKYLSECDLLVYDLHQGNPKDVELAIQALKKYNVEEEKVLILISSLMVWNKTLPKMREVDENGKFIEEKAGDGTGAEGATGEETKGPEDSKPAEDGSVEDDGVSSRAVTQRNQTVEKTKKYVQVPYTEEDFKHRLPSDEYEELKALEDELLAFKKDNVKIYILASGIMYGAGESIFEQHFKKAWL
jgi:adenylate kinase